MNGRKAEQTPEPEQVPEEEIERLTGDMTYAELQKRLGSRHQLSSCSNWNKATGFCSAS